MKFKIYRFLGGLLLSIVWSNLAYCVDRHVYPDGSGIYPNIQSAINSSTSGDRIILHEGVFTGTLNKNLDFLGKNLVLKSLNEYPHNCIIDCENSGRGFLFHSGESNDAKLIGVTVINGSLTDPGSLGGGIYCDYSSPTIDNCIIRANYASWGGGGVYMTNSSAVIMNSIISNNQSEYCGGVYFNNGSNGRLETSLIFNNSANKSGGGIVCHATSSPAIISCTISNNHAGYRGGGAYIKDASVPYLTNVIVWDNTGFSGPEMWIQTDGSAPYIVCSDIDTLGISGIAEIDFGYGNIALDPYFCDLESGDLSLADVSPCLPQNNPISPNCGLIGGSASGCGGLEFVSASFDKVVYQNGIDVAHLYIVTRNNTGIEKNVSLSTDLIPNAGSKFSMASIDFTLSPGEEQGTYLSWAVPGSSYSWEFDAAITLFDNYESITIYKYIESAFIGTPLNDEQIQQAIGIIETCYGSNTDLAGEVGKAVPFSSTEPQVNMFVNNTCMAGELDQAGSYGTSWGVTILSLSATLIDLYAAYLGVFTCVGIPNVISDIDNYFGINLLSMYGYVDTMVTNINCRQYSNSGNGLVDSMVVWITSGIDSVNGEFADVLLIEGKCSIMFEADSSWAYPDSTGLLGVYFSQLDQIGSATIINKYVHRLGKPESSNPNSIGVFKVFNCEGSMLDIGLLHYPYTDSLVTFRFPNILISTQTNLSIEVASNLEHVYICCDFNGDGQVDYNIYPSNITDVEEPDVPVAYSVMLYQNVPNPFNPTTNIRFDLPSSEHVKLNVYNIKGELIATLLDQKMNAGRNEVSWDAKDNNGMAVASGIYFYRLVAGDFVQTKKMVLLR